MSDPAALGTAESFARRFPDDPDGPVLLQNALYRSGRYAESVAQGRRVLELEPPEVAAASARCRACSAHRTLWWAYVAMDSLEAAVRTARQWAELRPESADPLRALSGAMRRQGRMEEALRVREAAMALDPGVPRDYVLPAEVALRTGDLDTAHRVLDRLIESGPDPVRLEALWWKAAALRNAGRFEEAIVVTDAFREARIRVRGSPGTAGDTHRAIILQEAGRFHESARLFRETGQALAASARSPADGARQLAWHLTHAATSLALAGDTVGLEALADTVQVLGLRSGYVRDPLLHFHVRGLLWEARGEPGRAADAYRRVLHSPTESYVKSVARLARILIEQERPEEAVALLEPQLRGPLESVGLYLTRAEILRLLEKAHGQMGS